MNGLKMMMTDSEQVLNGRPGPRPPPLRPSLPRSAPADEFGALIGRLYMVGRIDPSILPTMNIRNLLHKNNFRFSCRPEYRHLAV
jgi:hypothetical protein